MVKVVAPRWGWALTGSGHYFPECLDLVRELEHVDLFLSEAAAEVARMYGQNLDLPKTARLYRDTSASAAPVGMFYHGVYHTLVIAPATSNTVAKCVFGISDTLPTNVFAQAGKCRVPAIVFACDTAPEILTRAPDEMVMVYPRRIDLENTERLKAFEATDVVESLDALRDLIARRKSELADHGLHFGKSEG
jgi:dihydromethanopterin reductase (acceptor)